MAASMVLPRLCSRLPSLAIKPNKPSTFPGVSPFKSTSLPQVSSSSVFRPSWSPISRLPVELSCLMSMMPLHSTTASARLTSLLPIQSQNWGLVPQGKSMPLRQQFQVKGYHKINFIGQK